MNRLVAINDAVAIGSKRAPQAHLRIELLSLLVEVDDAEVFSPSNLATVRCKLSCEQPQQRRLAGAVPPRNPEPCRRAQSEFNPRKQHSPTQRLADFADLHQTLGLAFGASEVDRRA